MQVAETMDISQAMQVLQAMLAYAVLQFSVKALRIALDMKIVLHACCGPCSTVPLKLLREQGHELCVFFSNSNIQPEAEYIRRRDVAAKYASELGVEFIEGTYDPNDWIRAVGDHRAYGVERCSHCYRMRFAEPAAYAREIGADALATSLTISPYQFTNAINAELKKAADLNGVAALESDYRSQYRLSVELSRAAGMYRQNFCGCMYSQVEAQEQRDAAKLKRERAKAKRRLARSEQITAQTLARLEKGKWSTGICGMGGLIDSMEEFAGCGLRAGGGVDVRGVADVNGGANAISGADTGSCADAAAELGN